MAYSYIAPYRNLPENAQDTRPAQSRRGAPGRFGDARLIDDHRTRIEENA